MPTAPDLRIRFRPPVALEGELASEVSLARAGDPLEPLTILVGGTLLRPYLRRRLAELAGGHANLRLVTVSELARGLGAGPLTAAGRSPLGPLVARGLSREVARGARGYLRPVAGTAGLADSLGRLFRELRGARLGPAELEAGGADAKHAELAALYARDEQLRAAFFDTEECLRAADPARLEGSRLLVFGLWSAPALLLDLLAGVAARMPVVVLMPAAPGVEAACGELTGMLRERGAMLEPAPAPAAVAPPGGQGRLFEAPAEPLDGGALAHVQRHLFAPDPEAAGGVAPDATLRLCSAPDAEREARAAARACLAWAAAGVAFHEMAVAYRDDAEYPRLLESAFEDAGIPVHMPRGLLLAERPLGRRTLALLALLDGRFERAEVMGFLAEEPLPRATHAEYGAASVAAWDRHSRQAGVVGGAEQWQDRLQARAVVAREREDSGAERAVGEIEGLARLVGDLVVVVEQWPDRAPWSEHLARLTALLTRYVVGCESVVEALADLGRLDALQRDPSRDRFVAFAVETVRSLSWDPRLEGVDTSFGRRGVAALDVNSLRHLRFRAVAILGLSERAFPPPPREDALLLDEERESLRAAGWRELPLRAHGPDPEPLQFALAVGAASERLALSYARTKRGVAGVRLPSSFFRTTVEALLGQRVEAEQIGRLLREGGPGRQWIGAGELGAPGDAPALDVAERARGRLAAPRTARSARALVEHDRPSARRARTAARERMSARLSPYDGALGPAAAAALAGHERISGPRSPTSLEAYATCPYRFLLGRVLGLSPVEEPEAIERIAATDRGTLVHAVLQRFLEGLPPGDRPSVARRAEHLPALQVIFDEECEREQQRGATGLALLWRYERRRLAEDLDAWYDAEAAAGESGTPFSESAFELRFGPVSHGDPGGPLSVDAPLEVAVGDETLRFTGRIDRVDWRRDEQPAFRVVDYKTGGVYGAKENGLRGGRALQLPLYLLAAAQRLGIEVSAGRAEYFYVSRRGGFRRIGFDGAALARGRERFDELLARMLAAIRDGSFQQAPSRDKCRGCDFDKLCDPRRGEIAERKSGDPRTQAFAELGDFDVV